MSPRFAVHHFHNPSLLTVAINVNYIWQETLPKEKPCARLDGWWGPHEYVILPQPFDPSSPYMAWIPSLDAYRLPEFARLTGLDPSIILLDFTGFPLVPVQGHFVANAPTTVNPLLCPSLPVKPCTANTSTPGLNFCSASEPMKLVIDTQINKLADRVIEALAEIRDDSVRLPTQALSNLKQAYYWNLLPGANTAAGHHLILAGMKRAVMELHGFILWYQDYKKGLMARPVVRKFQKWFRSRGALVENQDDRDYLEKRDIPVWMKITAEEFETCHSAQIVSLTPIPIHQQPMFPAHSKGGHHTALLFYPPDPETGCSFELAARGYAGRCDIYRFDSDIARVHEKIHNERQLAAGLYYPLIKGPKCQLVEMYQKDYDNIQPFTPLPPLSEWVIGRQQMEWPAVMQPAGTSSRPPPIKTAMPPPLLFFRCSRPARQESYFFVWAAMRNRWISCFTAADSSSRQNFFKSHQEWRDILSGALFKKESKTRGGGYLLTSFWRAYPQLIYDGDREALSDNCVPFLTDGTRLQPQCFDDSKPHAFHLKRLICYDIALTHIKHQFEETDDIIVGNLGFDAECQAERRIARSDLFRSNIHLPRNRPSWEDPDLVVKCLWFERFRGFLRDWPPIGPRESHLTTTFTDIRDNAMFAIAVNELLAVYYTTVLQTLYVIPTLMWTFPGTRSVDQYLSI